MELLKNEHQKSHENTKTRYICKQSFEEKYTKDKKFRKVRDHCNHTNEYRGPGHIMINLKHSMPKETSINFDSGSNYNYHFIIKKLAEKFEEQFTFLEETTEKYITFLVPIEKKVTRIGKNGEDIMKTIPFS